MVIKFHNFDYHSVFLKSNNKFDYKKNLYNLFVQIQIVQNLTCFLIVLVTLDQKSSVVEHD